MSTKNKLFIYAIIVALVMALPVTALANKKIWTAKLTTGAELHEVVGSRAAGSAVFATSIDGRKVNFNLIVFNLSGAPTAAHIHGPASTSENGPVIITLCSGGGCTFDSNTNTMSISGSITSSTLNQAGVSPQDFFSWLDDGMLYVNVHTALNPAGEARGQIHPQ